MRSHRQMAFIAAGLAAVGAALAAPSWANGPGHHGFGPPGGPPDGRHDTMYLHRLVEPCRAGCFDTARSCGMSAQSTAADCAQATCTAQVGTAQTACAPDPASDACHTAMRDLHTCAQPCTQKLRTAMSSCHDAAGACGDGCEAAH